MVMWSLNPQHDYASRLKKWQKKYRRELNTVHNHLDTFLKALQEGQNPKGTKFSFIHPEPEGVLAIDQRGAGPHTRETRLYVYPDEVAECLFVITIGDKDSQERDLATCRDFVREHRKETPPPTPG
jgi:hypothetical protein